MGRRGFAVVVVLAVDASAVVLGRLFAPVRYERALDRGEQFVADAPEPVVVAVVTLLVVSLWVVGMVYLGKLLYWCWRRVDEYVIQVWDTLLPESPVVRFGVGLTVMALVFLIGPLVVLQAIDFVESADPLDREQNETETPGNETTDDTTEHPEASGSDGKPSGQEPTAAVVTTPVATASVATARFHERTARSAT